MTMNCSRPEKLHFHLLLADPLETEFWKLEKSWGDLPSSFQFHKATDVMGEKGLDKRYGYWFRIWVGQALPKNLERALYVDCDTITHGDVTELWEVDISEHLAAVVQDPAGKDYGFPEDLHRHAPRFGLTFSPEQRYFNSGVMFINLSKWRQELVTERIEATFAGQRGWSRCFDQEELNLILQNQVLFLNPKWNLLQSLKVLTAWDFEAFEEFDATDYFEQPVIVHFAGNAKPESLLARSSDKRKYYEYLDQTHWLGERSTVDSRLIGRILSEIVELHYIVTRGLLQGALKHPWRSIAKQVLRAPYSLPLYVVVPLHRVALRVRDWWVARSFWS